MTGLPVRCIDVRFAYGQTRFHFDLSVPASGIAAVMGPSGSGKSTLLSLLAGFETPQAGRIVIGDEDVTALPPARRPVSMVFQENNLFAHLSVAANVGLGRSPSLNLTSTDRDAIAAAIARVGLGGKDDRLPGELSGGERQRVALARVLVRDRPVLLLDEPFTSLGPALRTDMLSLLLDLHRERAMTVLMSTHHPDDARAVADTIIFIEDGEVTAAGPTATFFSADAPEPFRRYAGNRQ